MKLMKLKSILIFSCLAASSEAMAAENDTDIITAANWIKTQVQKPRKGQNADLWALKQARQLFYRFDLDGGGVTDSDWRFDKARSLANRRSREIQRWLKQDLDADGVVTKAELEQFWTPEVLKALRRRKANLVKFPDVKRELLRRHTESYLQADTNNDQRITFPEMMAEVIIKIGGRRAHFKLISKQMPKSLDQNSDDIISLDEVIKITKLVARETDSNADGFISTKEVKEFYKEVKNLRNQQYQAYKKRKKADRKKSVKIKTKCVFPKPSQNSKLVALEALLGVTLSNVTVAGINRLTYVADIEIERGDKPIYIALASHDAMIWRFSGHVERVEAAVVVSSARLNGTALAGTVGLPRGKVHIVDDSGCTPRIPVNRTVPKNTKEKFRNFYGIEAGLLKWNRFMWGVKIPSGKDFIKLSGDKSFRDEFNQGDYGMLWKKFIALSPGGMVKLNPAEVTSKMKPLNYKILPQELGLIQLLREGKLVGKGGLMVRQFERAGVFRNRNFSKLVPKSALNKIFAEPRKFLITSKIRLPPGLYDGHEVKFRLKDGVEFPDGLPGKSTIVAE